jgi:hypothetical protein
MQTRQGSKAENKVLAGMKTTTAKEQPQTKNSRHDLNTRVGTKPFRAENPRLSAGEMKSGYRRLDQSRRRLSTSKRNQDWIEENEKSQHGELMARGETEIQAAPATVTCNRG